jgi:transposase
MYMMIHQMSKQGFCVARIARKLQISRTTVYEYLKRDQEQLSIWMASCKKRKRKLDAYEQIVLHWLQEHPDVTSAQIFDWLIERYSITRITEATVRNYVKELRELHQIPKKIIKRQYESVQDPPMGYQMQVDFGKITVKSVHVQAVKLHFISFVMSHSRCKYAYWLDRPFTTRDVISAHEHAFSFFGGRTEEIVYDQDSLLVVSEKAGEIIYTSAFQSYRTERGFRVFLCRKADPETKGKIENVVGFVKNNFARHRILHNLDTWIDQFHSWLERTGNGKVHNSTKKRPAEVFVLEKTHLKPVSIEPSFTALDTTIIARAVGKDNTIRYEGNRYSVPFGTYKQSSTTVYVKNEEGNLHIYADEGGKKFICCHAIELRKGVLIQNRNHLRDRSTRIEEFMNHVADQFSDRHQASTYLIAVRDQMPRFIRDQLTQINDALNGVDRTIADQALSLCIDRKLYRASDFKLLVTSQLNQYKTHEEGQPTPSLNETRHPIMDIKPETRDVNVYLEILKGGSLS